MTDVLSKGLSWLTNGNSGDKNHDEAKGSVLQSAPEVAGPKDAESSILVGSADSTSDVSQVSVDTTDNTIDLLGAVASEVKQNSEGVAGGALFDDLAKDTNASQLEGADAITTTAATFVENNDAPQGGVKNSGVKNTTSHAIENDLEELVAWQQINKMDLWASSDPEAKEAKKQIVLKQKKIPQRIANFVWLSFFLVLVWLLLWIFYLFLWYKETWETRWFLKEYMPKVEKAYYSVRDFFGKPNPDSYMDDILIPRADNTNAVADILQNDQLDYISKKEILTKGVKRLYTDTSSEYDKYEELKKTVSQQWYFPAQLDTISKWVFFNNSLQRAIVSIESVRFATALNFFSALDSFMTQLSASASRSKTELTNTLEFFLNRWEKDINNYIVSCYLNGYESSDCITIGDFERYYRAYNATGFDSRVFLTTMHLIQLKLENSDFPSLDVSMRSIDPLQNTINLWIEINTLKEDELQLTQSRWILNPHIYLVTSIINNLRESRYVITDTININSLKVNKKKIKVWGESITVNNSTFNFQLPLQSTVQREIYDFADLTQAVESIIPDSPFWSDQPFGSELIMNPQIEQFEWDIISLWEDEVDDVGDIEQTPLDSEFQPVELWVGYNQ